MPSVKRDDVGRLLLRLSVGGLMLFHGIAKVQHGTAGIAAQLAGKGLPHAFAWGVYAGEVVAPLLVIAGLWARLAALAIAFDMAVAVWLAHMGSLLQLGKGGGYSLELQALYLLGALAIALLGGGRYAVSRGAGRWS